MNVQKRFLAVFNKIYYKKNKIKSNQKGFFNTVPPFVNFS